MKKRLVAFLLVLIMVLGMLPVSAFAADDGVSPQALESNETQTIKYQILYVGDEFNIGYNYGASVNKTYTCQYSTGHSGFNHSILISEFRNVGVPALKGQLDSGYEFVGWADKADAVTAKYTGGDPIVLTKDNPTKTIYAIWMPFFDLKYDANGGTGAPASQTRTAAHPTVNRVTFTVPNQTPSKEGYTFKGWADSSTATTAQYQPGDTVDVKHENSPKTVYAVWEGSDPIPVPSYDDLKSAIGKIQVKDVSTPSCGTENYDLIDNTQSEPFNWTKTARLDQPGKYDVTIKTAPYVAKYNSEKSKTHELNNANQTTLKLVISYENNTWKLDDGLRVIEVKHSEQTPPTDKPDKPTKNDVTGVVVDIVCVTTTGTHDTVQYPLGHPTDAQHTIGEVVSDGAGGYICPVTVRTAWFVQQASNLVWKVQHTPTAQTITFNLTYDKNSKTWVKPAANPRIEATHEVTPPTKPTALDGSFAIVCKNNEATHAYKADYIATPRQYTISDVQKDEQGYYVTATVTVAPNLAAYNNDTRVEHRLVDEQDATLTITFRYDTEATGDGNRKWQQQGDLPVVEVICKEIEAPTREDIFGALNGLVTVTCINRFWKDGNNNMDCGQGQYAAKAGIAGQEYTLEKGENAGTWVVTFDPNGGTPVPLAQEVEYGHTATKPVEPTLKGYTFDGWYLDGEEEPFDFGTTITSDITLTAKWEINKYTVTFDSYGGSKVDPQVVEYGLYAQEPEEPTLKGFTFAYWYLDDENEAYDFENTPVTADITLTAKWEINKYTVTFDSYGGSKVDPQVVEYGLYAQEPEEPTLKGFTFAYWYLDDENEAYDFENTPVTADITLTAKWNINKYTVAFNTDGGTPVPPAQEVEYGLTATEPAAPEKTGYTFDGWYLGDEKYDFSAAVEQNITLTAKWQKKTFTVKYYLPDETGAWVEKKMDTVDSVDYATYSLWTPNAEDGYEFSGWYQKPADIGVKAKVEKLYMAKEWKLYGKFTPIEYTIQYVYNDGKATSTNPTAYTVESDTITLADATGADWGKTFLEWHDENGQKITEIPTGSTGNRVITAYWNWPVHLHYLDKDNNEIESATLYVSELEPGACVLPTGEKTGYDFDGWYEAKKDIGTASHKLNALSIAKKWELYGRYTAKTDVSYTVKYLREGDNKVLAPEKVVTDQTFDTEVTEQAADVVGYTPDAPSKTMILDEYNKVLTFSYSANTYDYTVRHIKQLPDGSYDEANAEVETLSGKFEALAAVTAKDYGSHYPTNDADTKQNIKIEKGLTIDVKYDLDEHTLTFETNGGSAINPITVRHGNAVARPADPTKDKYTFIGWYADPEFTEEYDFATVLEADKTIYAKFELTSTPIGDIYVRYDVLHIKQLPDGTYDLANAEVEHLSAKKDTTVTAVIKDYRATHHVNVNRTLSKLTGTAIQPYMGVDGKPVYTILSVYYDLDFHTLTFDTMGGSKIAPETVRHGLTVAKPKDPVNGGYWFDGWYTDKTYRTPYNFATPLTQDTTIYAKWFLIVLPGVTDKKATPKLNTSDHFAYVQGYPNGTVKPAGNITRAETAAILFRLMDDASRKTYYSTKSGFRDVASGSWYNTYVATLNNAGVITDSSNGYFRPNEAITRAELAAMLAKFSETTGAANYFNDVSAKYWAANAIAICAKLGWINGYPDGTFRPDKNVTRAELMAMINRATGRAPKSADAFLPGMKTWIDNTSDKWYYLDVQEATNSHSYTVKGSETWTALTSDPNWSLYE